MPESTALLEKRKESAAKAQFLHQAFEESGEDKDFTKVQSLGSSRGRSSSRSMPVLLS